MQSFLVIYSSTTYYGNGAMFQLGSFLLSGYVFLSNITKNSIRIRSLLFHHALFYINMAQMEFNSVAHFKGVAASCY